MTTPARRRIMKDMKRMLAENSNCGFYALPTENSVLFWRGVIFGPPETPFEDATFLVTLEFTEEYPIRPPKVLFKTVPFHPNVYKNGEICLDILQKNWSSTYDVYSILASIQSLLADPNPDSPANPEAAHLFVNNMREYVRRVDESVVQSFYAGNHTFCEGYAELVVNDDSEEEGAKAK